MKKSHGVMLVGPRSSETVTYGMSIAFDLLISGFIEQGLPHVIVNRSAGMDGRRVGTFSIGGIWFTILMLLTFWRHLSQVDTVYLTIGTSVAGFVRDMLMIWPAWILRRKIVLHLHGGGFFDFYSARPTVLKQIIKSTFARADTLIVLGGLLRNQFEFVPNVKAKLKVVPNGLPTELQVKDTTAKVRCAPLPFRLLYLSNMIPSKGYLDVLEACHLLYIERGVPIECDFCGAFLATVDDKTNISPTEAEAEFRRLIREKGLQQVVTYHGTVRGEQKQEILQNADVFVLPTSYPWEGQPISIIEAMAFGLPVISTHYRGIPEQVVSGYNGYLLEKTSPEAIADIIERLACNNALYEQLSNNATKHFQQHFTRDAHLSKLIPVILGQHESHSTSFR